MIRTSIISLAAFLLSSSAAYSQTLYTAQDSCRIEQILSSDRKGNDIIATAELFLGTPYVAGTLDATCNEQTIVNTRELDCTTFMEIVTAIIMTAGEGKSDFRSFCDNLKKIRYRDGNSDSYANRLHYISQWVEENSKKGVVKEIYTPCHTKIQKLHLNYMSSHPHSYKKLKKNPLLVKEIEKHEKPFRNIEIKYIPKSMLCDSLMASYIRNGDIIALVTAIEGLDVTHVGFAKWINGQLHLLHASSSARKVVSDHRTLHRYISDKKNHLGIRVFRIKN